jgi:hypothetical protein
MAKLGPVRAMSNSGWSYSNQFEGTLLEKLYSMDCDFDRALN